MIKFIETLHKYRDAIVMAVCVVATIVPSYPWEAM